MRSLIGAAVLTLLIALPCMADVDVSTQATGGSGTYSSPWTGWDTAISWSGNTTYYFPPGYYSYSTAPNWAQNGITLRGSGNPGGTAPGSLRGSVLMFTGSGNAVKFDAGASPALVVNAVRMENFTIMGNSSATNGIYIRALSASTFRNIHIRDVSGTAFYAEFLLYSVVEQLLVTPNITGSFSTQPSKGIYLTQRASGESSTTNTFIGCVLAWLSHTGIELVVAINNTFIAGASEYHSGTSTGTGVRLSAAAGYNVFNSVNFEQNNVVDALIDGAGNVFNGCRFEGGGAGGASLHFENPGSYIYLGPNTIVGGSVTGSTTIDSAARGATFMGVSFWSNNITDNAPDTTIINCRYVTLSTEARLAGELVSTGLRVKTGTNARMGTATLSGGTVTVSTTAVTANSRIFLTNQSASGTPGMLYVGSKTAGTSFTIQSTSNTDSSQVAWMIVEQY